MFRKVVAACLVLSLAACSGSRPSDAEIKQQVLADYEVSFGGGFQVEQYEKVNGFAKDEKTYIADIRCDLVPLPAVLQKQSMPVQVAAVALIKGFGEKNGHVRQEFKATFLLTDNGWKLQQN